MGLGGEASIIGLHELAAERHQSRPARFTLDQWALLARAAIDDAGIEPGQIDGLVAHGLAESRRFVPATLAEYLGLPIDFGEVVDLGGATAAGMIWRAAAAIELGQCQAVLAVIPGSGERPSPPTPRDDGGPPAWLGASSGEFGSPQAEHEIPFGIVGQNGPYAQIAQRYAAEFGYDPRATASIAVAQRFNAQANPDAVWHGRPLTEEDVLDSPMIADPIRLLEIVMPVKGGAAVVIASEEVARRSSNRPVRVTGFGEHIAFKTPTYAEDMVRTPIARAADPAFAMAGVSRADVDVASIYDCYAITVLMTLEDAGFCDKGTGMRWVREHDLTYRGDFPVNTAGGQLSFGQAGMAGGMHHVCDAARQLMGRAGQAQIPGCDTAFVTGNGGIMSEQVALILQGA